MTNCDVAIIGAGPYGLSIAAHLKARGVDFRIFGNPMHTWMTQMPKGMRLKSEGFASSLYDPGSTFTLADYCKREHLPYADVGLPVPLSTFIAYGMEFQKKFVPELENKLVARLVRSGDGFQLELEDGEVVTARRVVVAVGISHFQYLPPELAALPKQFVTHSSGHSSVDGFRGREVVVVGAGASAVDLAALLHQGGAAVQLVARKPAIRFHDPPAPQPRPLLERIQNPMTGIGIGWKAAFCTYAPLIFRQLSEKKRLGAVKRILGPAPGWFVKQDVVGKVPFHLGVNITQANVQDGRVILELTDGNGARQTLSADHVIAATGYRVDLKRLAFLDTDILSSIRAVEYTPVLSSNFESSVPGLYFVGTSAANTFGPVLRFAYGAGFTAPRIAQHLARSAPRNFVRQTAAPKVESLNEEEVHAR